MKLLFHPEPILLKDSTIPAGRLRNALQRRLENCRLQLAAVESRAVLQRPGYLIEQRRQDCDQLGERLQRTLNSQLETYRFRMQATAASLQALSPLNVLARGYSLTRDRNGLPLTGSGQLSSGDVIHTQFHDGTITSVVQKE